MATFMPSRPSSKSTMNQSGQSAADASRSSWPLVVLGLIALFWVAVSILALIAGFTGHNLLYTVTPGSAAIPPLSLLGKIYLVTSGLMAFVVIAAISWA
jgi:hypothetical protein